MRCLQHSSIILVLAQVHLSSRYSWVNKTLKAIGAKKEPSITLLTPNQLKKAKATLASPINNTATERSLTLWWESILAKDTLPSDGKEIAQATLEHILPQNSDSVKEWVDAIPDPALRKTCSRMIGNLTALDPETNLAISNSSFDRKRQAFNSRKAAKRFNTVQQILEYPEWTSDQVYERTDKLAKAISKELGL